MRVYLLARKQIENKFYQLMIYMVLYFIKKELSSDMKNSKRKLDGYQAFKGSKREDSNKTLLVSDEWFVRICESQPVSSP